MLFGAVALLASSGRAFSAPSVVDVEVRIDPARDPWGHPWRLDVCAEDVPVTAEGRAVVRARAAACPLHVLGADGARWLSRDVALARAAAPVTLTIRVAPVSGRVHLPARGVRAALVFSDPESGALIPFQSDGDGGFRGFLPRASGWIVDVEIAGPPLTLHQHFDSVRVSAGPRSVVDLELPPVALRGTVVSEDGVAQAGVAVIATQLAGAGASQTAVTDGAGVFEFAGLPEGPHRIVAAPAEGIAEAVTADVIDGRQEDVPIVLRPASSFEGRLLATAGPVTGAEVRTWLPAVPEPDSLHAAADGTFSARLPADTREVGVSVAAPGYALRMTRVPVGAARAEIPLETAAGALVLEVPAPGPAGSVVLAHDGVVESLDFVARWAAMNGGGAREGRLLVPQMEPGDYAVCVVAGDERAGVGDGARPAGRCADGTLAAGGRLELSVAAP